MIENEFEFIVDEHVKVKTFLKKHEVSKGLLARLSFVVARSLSMDVGECNLFVECGDQQSLTTQARVSDLPQGVLDILFE